MNITFYHDKRCSPPALPDGVSGYIRRNAFRNVWGNLDRWCLTTGEGGGGRKFTADEDWVRASDFAHRPTSVCSGAEEVLATFSAALRDQVELDKLTSELLNVVGETMHPEEVSLRLRVDNKSGGIPLGMGWSNG